MAEKTEIEAETAAQKAYAAAAEAQTAQAAPAPGKPVPAELAAALAEPAAPEVVFPSKAKRMPKPKAAAPTAAAPLAVKPASAPAKKTFKKAAPAKVVIQPKAKIAPQPKAAAPTTAAPKTVLQQLKEKTMETTEFTTKLKSAVGEAQAKAKEAFDKGAATFGEYSEFSKGNLEAVVASGKILASGMQSLGTTLVADGKTAFETLTAEVKELAAVKSPTDFFKLQAAFLRRNFETAIANTSKNSETVLKLASEAAAPISARVNLAVEKVKQAA